MRVAAFAHLAAEMHVSSESDLNFSSPTTALLQESVLAFLAYNQCVTALPYSIRSGVSEIGGMARPALCTL